MNNARVKVLRISTVCLPGENLGRYVLIVPLTPYMTFVGASAVFYNSQNIEVSGRIVSMEEEINAGKFPPVANNERVIDCRPIVREEKHKRMAQGGVKSLINSRPLTARDR